MASFGTKQAKLCLIEWRCQHIVLLFSKIILLCTVSLIQYVSSINRMIVQL